MKKKDRSRTKKFENETPGALVYWTTDEEEIQELKRRGYKQISEDEFEIPDDEEEIFKEKIKRGPKLLIPKKNKLPGPGSRTRP